jgi:adenylate kinase family enzyme
MRLAELGERICILGPSNSGKSTLAQAIAKKQGLEAIHLDRLHHLPHTDWKPRPADEFVALHDVAIAGERWVIDGNYSGCFARRFERATGVILLDIPTVSSLFRYVRRTIFHGGRAGGLEGGRESLKLAMLHYIAVVTPGNRRRYARVYRELRLPKVYLQSVSAIRECYREWELERN